MLLIKDIPEDQIMFYDIETNEQYAAYADLKLTGVQYGLHGTPEVVRSPAEKRRFKESLRNPDMMKITYNGVNFDNLVLYRYGYPVEEKGNHDVFLMIKTIAPGLPAYSLKFVNFFYFGDPHFPEMELEGWAKRHKRDKWEAPYEILAPYMKHDIVQTVNAFRLAWEVVQRPQHWRAYTTVEAPMMMPLEEMMLRGGEYLDESRIAVVLAECEKTKAFWNTKANMLSDGAVINANSIKQVGDYLDTDGFHLELTESGNWSLPKKELLDLRSKHPIAECTFQVRRLNNQMSTLRNYLEALDARPEHKEAGWIPKQYSTSRARTRRILSDSKFGINFQNPTKEAKQVQIVPPGWLGVWIDATQIENVVHIYESRDRARRARYEADPNWSDYVDLCNAILGTNLTKDVLDNRDEYPSPVNPSWSVYKQFKTVKLALNFGMGVSKYCSQTGLSSIQGKSAFDTVHQASPAIKNLQTKLITQFKKDGYVQDVFGHIYVANPRKAYKIVAYLIQGCGTGSLPKACIRGLYDVLHQCDVTIREAKAAGHLDPMAVVLDRKRERAAYGVLNGTTHDEIAARLSLALGPQKLLAMLKEMRYVMTEKFSPLFDDIPLRAKIYLSRTTAYDGNEYGEVDLEDPSTYEKYLQHEYNP